MFDWLKSRIIRWAAGTEAAAPSSGAPATKAPRGATLTTVLGPNAVGTHSPTWNEYDTRRHHVEWVYSAVRAVSQRIAGQPVRIGRKAKSGAPSGSKVASANPAASGADVKELPGHRLHEVFDQPDAFVTESQLLALVVASLEITGTAFVWVDEELGDGVTQLHYLPSSWIREDQDATVPLSSFIVQPPHAAGEPIKLGRRELLRFSYPDIANPLESLSPLKAAFRSVLADEEILSSQLATFANGAKPGLLVRIGQEAASSPLGDADEPPALTEVQRRVLRERIKAATSGAANSGEPIILDSIVREVSKLTFSPAELDFVNSGAVTRDRILMAFGVNPIVLGWTENANRASATVADELFCYAKLGPICRLLSDGFTAFFRVHCDDPSLVVWVDCPKPRDPDGRRADLEQLARYGAIRVNELRREHGLPDDPDGDAWVKSGPALAAPTNLPADPPDRDDRKALTAAEAELLSVLMNADREKRFIVDEHTPPPLGG